jgi:hypothetical protein
MTGNWNYPLGAMLLRGLLLPVAVVVWVAVIVLALRQNPAEADASGFNLLTDIILHGHQ